MKKTGSKKSRDAVTLRESGTRLKPSVKGTMHRMFGSEYILLYNNILVNK
jgi:hypothetical protein